MVDNLIRSFSDDCRLFSQTVEEEVPIEDEEEETEDDVTDEDDEGTVEDEEEEDKPKTKKVETTVWDWVLVNDNKPIWTRKLVLFGVC